MRSADPGSLAVISLCRSDDRPLCSSRANCMERIKRKRLRLFFIPYHKRKSSFLQNEKEEVRLRETLPKSSCSQGSKTFIAQSSGSIIKAKS